MTDAKQNAAPGGNIEIVSENKCFAGVQRQYQHDSDSLNCNMRFAVYLPPASLEGEKVPVLYWLSGLTCTDENFTQKAGAQRIAAQLGMAIVAPDTSPRGEAVPDDEGYDLGQGAGFYVNATQQPWSKHYQMYDYILHELPGLIEQHLPVSDKRSVAGHSMGGHGALVMALRNPDTFRSVSAFSPVCHPTACPWGVKAFSAYLGADQSAWQHYDTTLLMKNTDAKVPALVDQGTADNFLDEQLGTDHLIAAAKASDYPVEIQYRDGYDHSYFFIASFIEDHLKFHARHLK